MNNPEPMMLGIDDSVKISGLSKATLYRILGRGEIEAAKCGGRLLIRADSLRAYLDALPRAKIKAPHKPA